MEAIKGDKRLYDLKIILLASSPKLYFSDNADKVDKVV